MRLLAGLLLSGGLALGVFALVRMEWRAQQLAARQDQISASLDQTRRRVADLSARLSALSRLSETAPGIKQPRDFQKARIELKHKLTSARADLGRSVARTHEDLENLKKQGERYFWEFDLAKSRQWQRTGPVGLSLLKTDTEKQRYDVAILVDDFRLTKKHVNLYEPILFYPPDSPMPYELVINRIAKNQIHGYVGAPKYKQSELISVTIPGFHPSR